MSRNKRSGHAHSAILERLNRNPDESPEESGPGSAPETGPSQGQRPAPVSNDDRSGNSGKGSPPGQKGGSKNGHTEEEFITAAEVWGRICRKLSGARAANRFVAYKDFLHDVQYHSGDLLTLVGIPEQVDMFLKIENFVKGAEPAAGNESKVSVMDWLNSPG